MSGVYVIQDPHLAYGVEFIRRLHERFGLRAVCYYTGQGAFRPALRQSAELISPEFVAASYQVRPADFPRFVAHLASAHDVRAVIPFNENVLLHSHEIAVALGLSWAQPDVVPCFRDKFALKSLLRRRDPGLRLNAFARVHSPDEAVATARSLACERYVLKPADGAANRGVGVFSAGDPLEAVQRFWRTTRASSLLLEEFVAGTEYHCNGQTDAHDAIAITDVARYAYRSANGRHNLRRSVEQVLHGTPEFAAIEAYTRRVIATSGLRRCPFHAELKVDAAGPCLIECGARLIGSGFAPTVNHLHRQRIDVIDWAAHHYVTAEPYPRGTIDWSAYNSRLLRKVAGCSTRAERIHQLAGVAEVETLPEFAGWVIKPFVGQRLPVTTDLLTLPFAVLLEATNPESLDRAQATVERVLRWNESPAPISVALRQRLRDLAAPARHWWQRQTIGVGLALKSFR